MLALNILITILFNRLITNLPIMSLHDTIKFIKSNHPNQIFDSYTIMNWMFDSHKYRHSDAVELLKKLESSNMIKVHCCTSEYQYRVDYRTGELHGITRTWYKLV